MNNTIYSDYKKSCEKCVFSEACHPREMFKQAMFFMGGSMFDDNVFLMRHFDNHVSLQCKLYNEHSDITA